MELGYLPGTSMDLRTETASLVLLGSFNPAIFQPSWLAAKNLIRPEDAEQATIELIAPQVSVIRCAGLRLTVLPERFTAQCSESVDQVSLRDLVVGAFRVLSETPVTRLGLNWNFVVKLPSEDAWHRLGDLLAPKERWRGLLPGRPGMKSVTIHSPLGDMAGAEVNVKVEPVLTATTPHLVSIDLNYDYTGAAAGLSGYLDVIHRQWEPRRTEARRFAQEVASWSQP